ncbi:MAG: hypothetical protein QOE23_2461 [Pseudonocardiales bacterium]|nr:hypothetical protein [Pseudonocardiales bacterium]
MTAPVPDRAVNRRRRAVTARSATFDPVDHGWSELVVLLPSTDAATVLLLCEEAAERAG